MNSLLDSGLTAQDSPARKRSVQLSNYISLGVCLLVLLLDILYASWYGWYFIARILPLVALCSLVPLLLNRAGFPTTSRVWLSLFLAVLSIVISIFSKRQYYASVRELDYFSFRFFILASCALPLILFPFKEKRPLIITSLVTFLLLMMFDSLHTAFGVPYPEDLMLKKSSYDFTNIIVFVTYGIIVGATFFLKWISEKNEGITTSLIQDLNQMNEELAEKHSEIEAQSSELQAQSEALYENHSKLEKANKIIEEQKNHLFLQNKDLAIALMEKNKTLTETNHELIKHNNELSQFSHTVSHNLRGPVASLLGLIELLEHPDYVNQEGELKQHLKNSVLKLDNIIRDLGKIIDIRHDIFRIRQKILLESELESIQQGFKSDIHLLNAQFHADFSNAPEFYSVRPMVVSILYNLISNSLKYRSLERSPVIEISSEVTDQYFILTVKDNGLGIDLKKYGDTLFKMYKRFHHHTEGKGLGLYLIKMQAEALHGKIEVKSQINSFTEFKVYISIPENVEEQILVDETHSKIFYDAILNSTGVVWRGPISSDQYRTTYMKGIEVLRAYNTPNWITDLTDQGYIAPEDQQWLFTTILPEAMANGLARIAMVGPAQANQQLTQYLKGIRSTLDLSGISLRYFDTFMDAQDWIRIENENAARRINLTVNE